MSYGADNAGYIRYQIGNILLAQTEAIKVGAIERYADLCHQAVTLCFPKLGKTLDEKERAAEELLDIIRAETDRYAGARREKDQDAIRPDLFAACQRMMRHLLHKMSEERLYAFIESRVREGTSLAIQGPEDEKEELRA